LLTLAMTLFANLFIRLDLPTLLLPMNNTFGLYEMASSGRARVVMKLLDKDSFEYFRYRRNRDYC
jgi:hypothetical protein